MITLDFADKRAIYEQVKDKLRQLIIKGVLKAGDKLPSVRDLASTLVVNPNTVQKAYGELENEGYVYSIVAKGIYVSDVCAMTRKNDLRIEELYKTVLQETRELKFLGMKKEDIIAGITELFEGEVDQND